MQENNRAIFKFNGGLGALLCSHCRKIIKIGKDYTEEEQQASKGKIELPPRYCQDCAPNRVKFYNRYGDKIIFEHIGNEVIMTGGSWFRFGWPNVYDKAYKKYVESAKKDAELTKNQILTQEEFEGVLFNIKDEDYHGRNALYSLFGMHIYSNTNVINFVDPSGGPYISLGSNLNKFWPEGQYRDLIVESIQFAEETRGEKEDFSSTIIFRIKK